MFRLVYNSRSRIDAAARKTELGDIFTFARRNNRALGVTGALIVSGDAFAQTLEGDEPVVRELYERICGDDRHGEVTLLRAENVGDRVFGRWAMAEVSGDGGPDTRLLSNADRGTIVAAGRDERVTPEQEPVLAFMRESIAHETLGH
jgi:FAD-dependent sensor of blue light